MGGGGGRGGGGWGVGGGGWEAGGRRGGAYFHYIYSNFEDQIKNNEILLAIYGIATLFYGTIVSLLNIKFIEKS